MRVHLKLIATYRRYLPAQSAGNTLEVEVGTGVQPSEVLRRFGIPTDGTTVILVNGISPAADQVLNDGDVVCAFPATAGG